MEEINASKKRILYFIPTFPVLTETFIAREVIKVIEIGEVDVRILSLSKDRGSIEEFVKDRVTYKRIGIPDCIFALSYLFQNSKMVFRIYKEIFFSSGLWNISNLYLFFKSLAYANIIKQFNPDHIHCHFLSDPSTIILIVSRILNIPFSVSGHAKDVFLTGTLIKEKVKYSKFTTICNSFAFGKALEKVDKEDRDKLKLLFHGIDINLFSDPPKKHKPNRPAIFLGGTRLIEKKRIKNLIKQKELRNYVFIHGEGNGTPFEEVKEFYKIADIFVLPSIETVEGDVDGVPTVVIEAAIAKLPIITTNAGGITDLINETTGLIVPQRDADSLALAIEKLILNPELRVKLGKTAYEKASVMFDININARKLQEEFLV